MKKYKELTSKYILSRLYQKGLVYFTAKTFSDLFEINRVKAHQRLFSLKKGNLIREVERGKYLLLGFEPEKVLSNPFFIANQIVHPSYVSFRSALNHYGFTEQVPFTVFLATTKRKNELRFDAYRYKYVTFSPHKFFGYTRQVIGELGVLLAEGEKALVDSLDQLGHAGGFLEVAKALFNARPDIDANKLIDYAVKMENRSLCSRLGFLLEKYKMRTKGIETHLSASFVPLDPKKPKGKVWNKKWRVNVNLNDQELFSWRES